MFAETATRVPRHTSPSVNAAIESLIERNVAFYRSNPSLIGKRLAELDREWDIERVLATGSSTLTLTGLFLGTSVNKKWLWLSLGVQAFYVQHALQGWCPPLPIFRRLGVRSVDEINQERQGLISIRDGESR